MGADTAAVWISRSDGQLLADFAEHGQEACFTEIVRRHGAMVLAVCRSVLGNTPDAEDAAQAVFLTLSKKADHEPARRHLAGWLHRVAWYVATRKARSRQTRQRHEQEAARLRAAWTDTPDEPAYLEQLHAALAVLAEPYRAAMILHYIEGRTQREAAVLLGCSIEAIAVRLHRGRKMLRSRLGTQGGAAFSACVAGSCAIAGLGIPRSNTGAEAARAAAALEAAPVAAGAAVTPEAIALANGAVNMLFWAKIKSAAMIAGLTLCVGAIAGKTTASFLFTEPEPVSAKFVITDFQDPEPRKAAAREPEVRHRDFVEVTVPEPTGLLAGGGLAAGWAFSRRKRR